MVNKITHFSDIAMEISENQYAQTLLAPAYLLLPLRQWGAGNVYCLPLSVVQLKGKHCKKNHCRNGVVDTFGPYESAQI
jgi:hypothetical protein